MRESSCRKPLLVFRLSISQPKLLLLLLDTCTHEGIVNSAIWGSDDALLATEIRENGFELFALLIEAANRRTEQVNYNFFMRKINPWTASLAGRRGRNRVEMTSTRVQRWLWGERFLAGIIENFPLKIQEVEP
jgi:hypothetical protein